MAKFEPITVVDKTGQTVCIKFCDQMGIGPEKLTSFFFRNMAELIENGYGSSWPSYSAKSMAIYAEIDDVIVGHIVFNMNSELKQSFIVLSAVDKNYRNRGIYKLMHYQYEKVSKNLGAKDIFSFVHVNNTDRLASAASVGLYPRFYKMYKDI